MKISQLDKTLILSTFTRNFSLHVPRTNALLCQGHIVLWLLFSCCTAHDHSLLRHSQLLVGKYNARSLHRWIPRRLLLPRQILFLMVSFLSLFEELPFCVSMIGFEDKLNECLISCFSVTKTPSIVKSIGAIEFERSLATPTAQILEHHDFRTFLDFLLMKLRTALHKNWLQSLPYTRYFTFLICICLIFEVINSLSYFHFFSVFSDLSVLSLMPPVSLKFCRTTGNKFGIISTELPGFQHTVST